VLHCVAARCNVLQCVAAHYSRTNMHAARTFANMRFETFLSRTLSLFLARLHVPLPIRALYVRTAARWNEMQRTGTHYNALDRTACAFSFQYPFLCIELIGAPQLGGTKSRTATICNTLQHTATHCNTLCLATRRNEVSRCNNLQHTAIDCNALQHTATHCNTLQHTATHCNSLQRTVSLPI